MRLTSRATQPEGRTPPPGRVVLRRSLSPAAPARPSACRRQHLGPDALDRRDTDTDAGGRLVDADAGLERRLDGPLSLLVYQDLRSGFPPDRQFAAVR
jgi:hypothetical protein